MGIIEDVEILKREKTTSPWKNLAKRWSLTPTPQREAPIQIKSQNGFQINSQQKLGKKRFKKKLLKANPAMSRLTRLASTKIHISEMDLYSKNDDELTHPSNDVLQDFNALKPIMPSSLPYVPKLEENYWYDGKQSNYNIKDDTRISQNKESPSTESRPFEYLKVVGLIDHDRPTVYHQGHNRSSASHLGYSASKPKTPNFIMPTQPLQPSLEDNLHPARVSTIDHYSHLIGGPLFHDNNIKANREEEYYKLMNHNKSDRIGNNVVEIKGPSFQESRFHNPEQYQNEELDAYNTSIVNNSRGLQKPFKFLPSQTKDYDHVEEYELSAKKAFQVPKESYEQTNLTTLIDSTLGKDQLMYRRISASGHVSSILIPNISTALPHESPFADYTKHGLRDNFDLSLSEGFGNKILIKNDEDPSADKKNTSNNNGPPKPIMQISKPLELVKVGAIANLKKGELQRSSSGHISKEVVSNIVKTLPHESPFADYSRHGIREQPIQQEININSLGQSTLNSSDHNHEQSINLELVQIPVTHVPSSSVDIKRSPWASETGDPSHSIVHAHDIRFLPLENNTSLLAMAKPSEFAYTSKVDDDNGTASIPQTFATTSRVSLYSNNDVPSYSQILGVVPNKSNKSG